MNKNILVTPCLFCALVFTCEVLAENTQATNLPLENVEHKIDLSQYKDVQTRAHQQSELTIVVAISGGGQRASNLAAGVMMGMEEIPHTYLKGNLLQEVDYFSTVSGGSLAAGLYLRSLYDHMDHGREYKGYMFSKALDEVPDHCSAKMKQDKESNSLKRQLERGYHHSVARSAFDPRVLFTNVDRGDRIESRFDEKILGSECRENGRSISLGDIFVGEEEHRVVELPYWIANATIYQNGWIFPFAPNVIEGYQIKEYIHRMKTVNSSTASDCHDSRGFAWCVPLALGMTASATFPVAIPATTLKISDKKYLHLFDGGLSDNLGVLSAIEILRQSQTKHKLLLVIDAFPGELSPFSAKEGSPRINQVLGRVTGINKDSLRNWMKGSLASLLRYANVETIYLDIDDSPVREIGTSLNIAKDEQEHLFDVGRKLITEASKTQIESVLDGYLLDD